MSSAGRLVASIVPAASLAGPDRRAMWALFVSNYEDVHEDRFYADLDGKQEVIVLRDGADLKGFCTLRADTIVVDGTPRICVFTGDTLVDPAYWGQQALHRAFFRYLMRIKLTNLRREVWWFLISKGYRTYLLLSRYIPEHWPRYDQPTPPARQAVLDAFSVTRFGADYDAPSGVVRHSEPAGRVKPGLVPVDRTDPEVSFFLARNPGHDAGDELCCVGLVDWRVPAQMVWKVTQRPLRQLGVAR